MPNGKLRGSDFLRSQDDLGLLVQRALSKREADATIRPADKIDVRFQKLRVKMCARSWGVLGVGDRKALSGSAEFTFGWSTASGMEPRMSTVTVDLEKADAMPADDIMVEALNRLLDQIDQLSP
ncbi:hypothetical protein SAMN05518849_11127 [Sphingobium sp. AP50]|nr:hypothetical protein SAMN05518849_10928 [Sphingobium sp. AP50]SEJ68244.1 hypothetical protein SAMN05518849_11127 [Sphingobium sp. AP50]